MGEICCSLHRWPDRSLRWPSPICSIWPQSGCWTNTPIFQHGLCIFHHTEEAISFKAQVAVVFCLLVQLEATGERELQACSNTSGQNKSFLRRHPVTRLPVNDTSSSYSSWNDLVCVALLVVRETAGGSLEISLVIVWRCRQARREMETKTERKCTSLIFDLLH